MINLKDFLFMKKILIACIYSLIAFGWMGCEPVNGGETNGAETNWQAVECNPPLAWLMDFIPMPHNLPPRQMDPPDPAIGFFDRYQESDFLRITVSASDTIEFLHHTLYPCAYSIKGHVELVDNTIILSESTRKPEGVIPACICGANITSSIQVAHLEYDIIQLNDLQFPIHLYEGLDTLIMIRTDIPLEPQIALDAGGFVRDSEHKGIPNHRVVLQNLTGEISDTLYTNEYGGYGEYYDLVSCENDTLTITAFSPYDNSPTVIKTAFADMDQYEEAYWMTYYTVREDIKFKKPSLFN